MKVAFLEIDTEAEWAVSSLGPAFLAALARDLGHHAEMIRVAPNATDDEILGKIGDADPDLIGMSMTSRQWLRGRDVANLIRSHRSTPIIAGGLHATFSPEQVLGEPGFDAVCLGEGERPFEALLMHLDSGGTIDTARLSNIWVKGGSHPGLAPPVEELDSVPFMARDMLDERWGVVHMTTQRGCPFPCTYCAARMYDQLYANIGTYGRRRSIESVLTELEQIRDADALNYVIFLDDTFTINHPWILEFAGQYADRIGVPFSVHARAETMNDRVLEALRIAGCAHVVYGVESGSERIRRDVMKRPVSNDRLVDAFARTRETGMIVTANYMLGVPGETQADLDATLALHERLQPTDFGFFVFYPFPGTQLFDVCKREGYLPNDWQTRPARHDESILRLPNISQDDIAATYAEWERVQLRDRAARLQA